MMPSKKPDGEPITEKHIVILFFWILLYLKLFGDSSLKSSNLYNLGFLIKKAFKLQLPKTEVKNQKQNGPVKIQRRGYE